LIASDFSGDGVDSEDDVRAGGRLAAFKLLLSFPFSVGILAAGLSNSLSSRT
jgi:hypothetical protein